MKTLIIYYSRTGTTQKVAEALALKINADLEKISDLEDRGGVLGYIKSGREAMMELPAKILPLKHDLSFYDLVILGTPNWVSKMSSPMLALLKNYQDKFKRVAFFATEGDSGAERVFSNMTELIGRKPLAELVFKSAEVKDNKLEPRLENFVKLLK